MSLGVVGKFRTLLTSKNGQNRNCQRSRNSPRWGQKSIHRSIHESTATRHNPIRGMGLSIPINEIDQSKTMQSLNPTCQGEQQCHWAGKHDTRRRRGTFRIIVITVKWAMAVLVV